MLGFCLLMHLAGVQHVRWPPCGDALRAPRPCCVAVQAAVQGSTAAKQVLSAEVQLKQAVASGAGLLAAPGSSAVYKVLARRMFREFAGMIGGRSAQASAAYGRRMAQSAPSFSFSNSTLLQELLTAVQTLAQADPAVSGQLANITNVTAVVQVRMLGMLGMRRPVAGTRTRARLAPTPAAHFGAAAAAHSLAAHWVCAPAAPPQATANAIAALNEVVASAPSVEFMQKAMVVSACSTSASWRSGRRRRLRPVAPNPPRGAAARARSKSPQSTNVFPARPGPFLCSCRWPRPCWWTRCRRWPTAR